MSPGWGGGQGGFREDAHTHGPGRPLMLANWETNDYARAEMEEEEKKRAKLTLTQRLRSALCPRGGCLSIVEEGYTQVLVFLYFSF